MKITKLHSKYQFLKDAFIWGFVLWLIGYILGIVLFLLVPASLIGWIVTPFGIIITLWILIKKLKSNSIQYYFLIAVIWTLIAIICDYFLLVQVFKPEDGYYKTDVYLYYVLTFLLPLLVGLKKKS